jgi:hypothetical protein
MVLTTIITIFQIPVFSQITHTWSYGFGSNLGSSDMGTCVLADSQGDIYVVGDFAESIDFATGGLSNILTSAGSFDFFVTKYTSDGELIFAFNVGGSLTDNANAIAVDPDGNIYVTGALEGTSDYDPGSNEANLISNGSYDAFVAKYDFNGNFLHAFRVGGDQYEHGLDIAIDKQGNVYVSGVFAGTVDFDPGPNEYLITASSIEYGSNFFAKYDPIGTMIYAKSIGGSDSELVTAEIEVDSLGNLYLIGQFTETADFDPGTEEALLTASYYDVFFAKYDPDGNFIFAKQIGGSGEVSSTSLTMDNDDNLSFTGYFYAPTDFDAGDNEFILDINGYQETFIAKYNAAGVFINAIALQGSNDSYGKGFSISNDAQNNIYVTGGFNEDIDFDPGDDITVLSAGSNPHSLFLASYDADLHFRNAIAIPGIDFGITASCTLDPDGNIYITGVFNGEADFDPGPGESILTSNGYDDIFLAKYSQGMVHTTDMPTSTTTGFKIFPNPASNLVYLDTREAILDAHVLIINLAGQVVSTYKGLSGKHFVADISGLPPGIYILELAGDGKVFREKVVVER